MQAALARLVASELAFQRGTPPDAVYSFKHLLVQDAAHASLLRSTRQQLHAQLYQVELPGPKLPVTAPVGVEADRGRSPAGVDWHAPRQ